MSISDGSYDVTSDDNLPQYQPIILISQPKPTGPGKTFLFGQTLFYDVVNNVWDFAASGTGGRFGFCTTLKRLTKTTENFTGEVTLTKGADEDDPSCSVLVKGRVQKQAEGAIAGGAYAKVASTDPNKLAEWIEGTDAEDLIVGRYITNLMPNKHHNADEPVPNAVNDDWIKIDKLDDQTI